MAIATINQNFEIPGYAQVFLVAYPVSGYTGASQDEKIEAAYELFYTDGTIRKGVTKVSEFANLNENGLGCKFKALTVETNPNGGSKHPIAFQNFEAELEGTFYDVDVNHLKDIFSAGSGAVKTTTAATGTAGRSTLLVGGQKRLTKYAMLVRLQSGNGVAGEFDHYLFPRIVFDVDSDFKFTKKDALEMKFKATALYDNTFIDPDTQAPVLCFIDTVTAPAV